MIRHAFVCVVVAAGVLFPAATAAAHSKLIDSDPKASATVDESPTALRVEYSEPPISADNLVVEDGCGVDVVTSAKVEEKDIVAELAEGQPGTWKVRSRVISVVDGHETTDGFKFTVEGEADCAAATAPPERRSEENGGSVLPLVLALGGGTVVLVAVAFFLRRSS